MHDVVNLIGTTFSTSEVSRDENNADMRRSEDLINQRLAKLPERQMIANIMSMSSARLTLGFALT